MNVRASENDLAISRSSSASRHSKKMKIKTSRLNVRKYTFVVRIVEIWNSLPESVIQAKTVKQFEIGLDEHWKHQDHHGGVFVAIKNTFDSEEAEELKSTAEIIWGKLTLPSGSKLYIGSMYHPHTANTASMEEIQRNIRLASSNDKHTVWIGGDFNIPEINWKDLDNIHVKENSKNADIHQEFIELTTNCGLNQQEVTTH